MRSKGKSRKATAINQKASLHFEKGEVEADWEIGNENKTTRSAPSLSNLAIRYGMATGLRSILR
jgi:hypothetical protein